MSTQVVPLPGAVASVDTVVNIPEARPDPPSLMQGNQSRRDLEDSRTSISICPETLYAVSMWIFTAGIVVCAVITFGFIKPDMSKDPIIEVYGAVNACIAFDYAPANAVFAVIYMPFTLCQAAYAALFYYRVTIYFPEESLIRTCSKIYCPIYVILVSQMVLSVVIGPTVSVVVHTVPYQVRSVLQ